MFKNKTVLITGASRGIGLACAREFKAKGANVFTAQRTISDEFAGIEADFNELSCCQNVIDQAVREFGSLDVLINNAGFMMQASCEEMDLEQWRTTLNINLTVPFLLIKYALSYLKNNSGSIVNIGSIEGLASNPGHSAYCASKAGLHGLTRAVAVDHGGEGVRCNAVAPGWINTELNEEYIESMDAPADFRKSIGKIHPLNRTGGAQEVAQLVVFLASVQASFITGQVYTIDGGRTSKLSLP